MFHTENGSVRSKLLSGNFGLEKESLRITENGSFALTLHPFPDNKNIVYDFCENQTEINTDVAASAQEAVDLLQLHTAQIQQKLSSMDEREYLWPFSNPPFIKNERDIPIARHNIKAEYADGYREYLADRYGRYKMSLCGIHVNFSFSDELLKADFELSATDDFEEYKSRVYLDLAAGLAAYGWIVTALTAASPLMDESYFERGKRGITAFNGLASTRCSELGYWNYFTPAFDYSDIHAYAGSIQQYVDAGLIASPTELYYPVRLKSHGKNNLKRLADEGVSHIELRTVDLNPFELSGLNVKDLEFIQLLFAWIASKPAKQLTLQDQVQAAQNYKNAAHYDLKTVKIVIPSGKSRSVVSTGLEVISAMKEFYHDFPDDTKEILAFEEEKFLIPEKRYAWMVRGQFGDDYAGKGLELAKDLQEKILKNV